MGTTQEPPFTELGRYPLQEWLFNIWTASFVPSRSNRQAVMSIYLRISPESLSRQWIRKRTRYKSSSGWTGLLSYSCDYITRISLHLEYLQVQRRQGDQYRAYSEDITGTKKSSYRQVKELHGSSAWDWRGWKRSCFIGFCIKLGVAKSATGRHSPSTDSRESYLSPCWKDYQDKMDALMHSSCMVYHLARHPATSNISLRLVWFKVYVRMQILFTTTNTRQ